MKDETEKPTVVWPYEDAPFDADQVRALLEENAKLRELQKTDAALCAFCGEAKTVLVRGSFARICDSCVSDCLEMVAEAKARTRLQTEMAEELAAAKADQQENKRLKARLAEIDKLVLALAVQRNSENEETTDGRGLEGEA